MRDETHLRLSIGGVMLVAKISDVMTTCAFSPKLGGTLATPTYRPGGTVSIVVVNWAEDDTFWHFRKYNIFPSFLVLHVLREDGLVETSGGNLRGFIIITHGSTRTNESTFLNKHCAIKDFIHN